MATYHTALAGLRARATSEHDVVRGPASLDDVQRLRAAVKAHLDLTLPKAYEDFLLTCNGVRVDGGRILGVDADVMASPTPDAPTSRLDACLAFNLERRQAADEKGYDRPFLYLAWYDEATWAMKPDGSCWEIDAETLEDIEEWKDCGQMLTSVANRLDGDY